MTEDDLIHRQQGREAFMLAGSYIMAWGQLETRLSWSFHELAPNAASPNIDPDNISRSLTHLLTAWRKSYKAFTSAGHKAVDEMVAAVKLAAPHRNTICHGFDGVWTDKNDPEFALVCWSKYHETKMLGSFPKQTFYVRSQLYQMIDEIERLSGRIMDLTHDAHVMREKGRVPTAS